MSDTERGGLRELFVGWFDYYAERATTRLVGLTDEEYLWEPAPQVPAIAWRLVHVCSMLVEHGLRAVAFEQGKADFREPSQVPATAAEALAVWERSIQVWKHDIAAVSEQRLWEPMGSEDHGYEADPVASFVEHIHDEFIHHSAEIALLRDLYRCRSTGDG